jgi:hypothetical protein
MKCLMMQLFAQRVVKEMHIINIMKEMNINFMKEMHIINEIQHQLMVLQLLDLYARFLFLF